MLPAVATRVVGTGIGAVPHVRHAPDRHGRRMSERVIVIGAGAAGLAAAAELRRRGVPAVVLERGDGVGAAWRSRYDRLRLNSSRWFSQLPGARFEDPSGPFPSRDEMVGYLERYAARRALDVR